MYCTNPYLYTRSFYILPLLPGHTLLQTVWSMTVVLVKYQYAAIRMMYGLQYALLSSSASWNLCKRLPTAARYCKVEKNKVCFHSLQPYAFYIVSKDLDHNKNALSTAKPSLEWIKTSPIWFSVSWTTRNSLICLGMENVSGGALPNMAKWSAASILFWLGALLNDRSPLH